MTVTRRSFLAASGLVALGGLSACSGSSSRSASSGPQDLSFWYWSGGLSDAVVRDVTSSYRGRATISARVVDGDFEQQLTTALSSAGAAPDVTGVKGEDMASFLTRPDDFLDLDGLGARDVAGTFAAAKYAAGASADGRQIGLPIDLGPTALFLRADLWAQAGLPHTPEAVGALTGTWDGWFEAAARLKAALPGTYAVRNSADVFAVALAQQPETFVSRSGAFVGDGGGARVAWDLAVRSVREGVQAGVYDDDAFGAALTAGTLTGHLGPAWNGLDIESGAPSTAGAWRVAAGPGGPADIGGSYLTLPRGCRDPELCFAFVRDLLTPDNQAKSFADAAVFPAVPAAYALPALTAGQAFYGGQATIEVFGAAARDLPAVYESPKNAAVSAPYGSELANVEGGKDPAQAWADAVTAAAAIARASA